MNFRRVLDHWLDVLVFVLILVGTLSAVNYFESSGVFDAQIMYVNNIKVPYSLIVHVDNTVDENLEYDIEVLYKKDNLVVATDNFECSGHCERKLVLKRFFFDRYDVVVRTKHNGRYYEEKLDFNLEKPPASFDIDLPSDLYYDTKGSLKIRGEVNSPKAQRYIFEIYPKSKPEFKQSYHFECTSKSCDFDLEYNKQILFGDYIFNAYSDSDNIQKKFEVILEEEFETTTLSSKGKKILYDSKGRDVSATMKLKKSKKGSGKKDIEFEFSGDNKVKKIKVPGADPADVSIGYEKVPKEKVKLLNTITDVFAIDPHVPDDVEEMEVTFVATGSALLKCADYNFTTQTCNGEYVKLLETIPGKTYTFSMTPKDPQFVQVTDYIIAPSSAACQSFASGWAPENCDDTSYEGYDVCDGNAEYTFCDDNLIESHGADRSRGDAGVRMYFEDTSQSSCQNIEKVEVISNVWFVGDAKGTRDIKIDADGDDSFTTISPTIYATENGNVVTDVTTSEAWSCASFFEPGATAGIEASWLGISGGSPQATYDLYADTLVYRVSYNYSIDSLNTDKSIYIQQDNVTISGSQAWTAGSTVTINITRNDSTVDTYASIPINSTQQFEHIYEIGDYYSTGQYTIYAQQEDDASINATTTFDVHRRIPTITHDRSYYSPAEFVEFRGDSWNRSGIINITTTTPLGKILKSTHTTTPTGLFSYNWQVPTSINTETGVYDFNFTESQDSSYNEQSIVEIVFRPVAATSNLADINMSDGNTFNVGGNNGNDVLDVNFGQVMETADFNLDNYIIKIKYSTADTAIRTISVYNAATLTWDEMCTVPDSTTPTTYSCDVTSAASSDPNNVQARLTEDGNQNVHWDVDFVFAQRNISSKGPVVTLIEPQNNTLYNTQDIFNLTYQADNTMYDMANCSLYLDGSYNQSNSSQITNGADTNFTLQSPLSEGLHTWMVSCIGDDPPIYPQGNSSIWDIYIDYTAPIVDLAAPANDTKISIADYNFSASFSDNFGLKNATVMVWNSSGSLIVTNSTTLNSTSDSANLNITFPQGGIFYWNYLVYDTANNSAMNATNYTITVDYTPPQSNLISPQNNSAKAGGVQNFVSNFSDNVDLKNATLMIWNSSGSLYATNSSSLTGKDAQLNLSYLLNEEDMYYWNYLVYDQAGNSAYNNSNLTFSIDASVPHIEFVSPSDANNSWVDRWWTYINVTVDDFSLNNTWLEWEGGDTNYSMGCSAITTTKSSCSYNLTPLVNGNYSYRVCADDAIAQQNCTLSRVININKTLPQITINSPISGNTYYSGADIYFNITTLVEANSSWYNLSPTDSTQNLSKISSLEWSGINGSLAKGYYNVTFYAEDEAGNLANATLADFYVVVGKHIDVVKKIESVSDNSIYKIVLNVTNSGPWKNYTLYDLIGTDYSYYNFSVSTSGSKAITGSDYGGNLLYWNLSIASDASQTISYNINSTLDYGLNENYIVSID